MTLEFRVNGRIGKPVAEVFDAVVNPKKLSGYFTTIGGASAPLVEGTTVTWWGMAPVVVDEVDENAAYRKFKRPFRAVCWVGGGRASPVLGTDRTSVSGISASRGHAAALSAAMLR